jgi:hypothetical protein
MGMMKKVPPCFITARGQKNMAASPEGSGHISFITLQNILGHTHHQGRRHQGKYPVASHDDSFVQRFQRHPVHGRHCSYVPNSDGPYKSFPRINPRYLKVKYR